MVDHVGFEEMLSHGAHMTGERMEHLFSSKIFYSHRNSLVASWYNGGTRDSGSLCLDASPSEGS